MPGGAYFQSMKEHNKAARAKLLTSQHPLRQYLNECTDQNLKQIPLVSITLFILSLNFTIDISFQKES